MLLYLFLGFEAGCWAMHAWVSSTWGQLGPRQAMLYLEWPCWKPTWRYIAIRTPVLPACLENWHTFTAGFLISDNFSQLILKGRKKKYISFFSKQTNFLFAWKNHFDLMKVKAAAQLHKLPDPWMQRNCPQPSCSPPAVLRGHPSCSCSICWCRLFTAPAVWVDQICLTL